MIMNITQRAYHHVEESSQLHSFLCNQDGLDIATLHRVTPDQVSDSDHKAACLDDEGWRATVNLVAAAPELLTKLKELADYVRCEFASSEPLCQRAEEAMALVSKATQGTSP